VSTRSQMTDNPIQNGRIIRSRSSVDVRHSRLSGTSLSRPTYNRGRKKIIKNIISKSPTCSSCEIPILKSLDDAPNHSLQLKQVVRTVLLDRKWFPELSSNDLDALYPNSHRRISETVLKYARKNLTLKNELFSTGITPGVWRATEKGLERIHDMSKLDAWRASYSVHPEAIIIEYEKP
jgi:hypothetical protein